MAGEEAPAGLMLRTYRWLLRPYVEAGYRVWFVGRRHPMPPDHTVAEMAEDYARVIRDEFGGRVDLVVGESTGGVIGRYLAAGHPESFGTISRPTSSPRPGRSTRPTPGRSCPASVCRSS